MSTPTGATWSRIGAGTRPVVSSLVTGWSRKRAGLRALPPGIFDFSLNRTVRVPTDGYLRHGACFYRAPVELVHQRVELHASRDEVWISWRGHDIVRYPRCYRPGRWIPEPRMRPEPPPPARPPMSRSVIEAPELDDYARCAHDR